MSAQTPFRKLLKLGLVMSLGLATSSVVAATRFVDPASPGPMHNGTTWTLAYTSLQTALGAAVLGDEIWVANGVYLPTTTTDRNESFVMPQGVKVFGGFAGFGVNETLLSQRNIQANRAILSGNIGNALLSSDNSYTVVVFGVTTTAAASLDGFYITAGNANGGFGLNQGAGMDIFGSPLISNCILVGNVAASSGGAVLCGGDVVFQNCVFSGNTANIGAAIDAQGNHIGIHSCTIANNTCTSGSGAVRILNGDGLACVVDNNILVANIGLNGSLQTMQFSVFNAMATVNYNAIHGLDGSLGGTGNIDGTYRFVDDNGPDNILGTVDDNYALRGGCVGIDAGSNTLNPVDLNDLDDDGNTAESTPLDITNKPRRIEDVVNNTGAGSAPFLDMGAYEFRQPVRVICVNDTATGSNNGTTWANAYTNMQSALTEAGNVKEPNPEVIWAAMGTYKPSVPAGRAATFTLLGGVSMFGGFDDSGTQGSLSQRNPDANSTTLSGDIGVVGDLSDNSYHVVTANGSLLLAATTLDGFVIAAGNANGTAPDNIGGGIRAFQQTSFDPVIRNCKFVGNQASLTAAAIECNLIDLSLVNCVVSGNGAAGQSSMRFANISTPQMINCTVANNGLGLFTTSNASLSIDNCILVDNNNAVQSSQVLNAGGTISMNYSCVEGLSGSLGGSGNIGVLPSFVDPNGADNIFGTADDNYHLLGCSSVIDAGDFDALPNDDDDLDDDGLTALEKLQQDIAYDFRWRQDLSVPDTGVGAAPVDMGAYEFQDIPSGGTCPADCFPVGAPNDVVDIDDLVTVITQWGNCVNCAGDVFPPCKNQVINIDDLVSVVTSWGNCP